MIKFTNEQLVARLRYYLEQLKTCCGDRKDLQKCHINKKTLAQIFQEIEEDEDIKDIMNANIVFYKDMNYKWQYEIRRMYNNERNDKCCMKIVKQVADMANYRYKPAYEERSIFGYAMPNVFDNFYETKLEAQKACAKSIYNVIESCIRELT